MQTRCKFVVVEASPKDGEGPFTARLTAVIEGSPENKSFFAATPHGDLRLSVVRRQHFAVGQEFYLDLTPAAPAETSQQTVDRVTRECLGGR